jgi:hypothetical protein
LSHHHHHQPMMALSYSLATLPQSNAVIEAFASPIKEFIDVTLPEALVHARHSLAPATLDVEAQRLRYGSTAKQGSIR